MKLARKGLVLVSSLVLACASSGRTSDTPPADILRQPEHPRWSERAPDLYRTAFETSRGQFVIEVHRDWSPIGADHFYNLVRNGYYDETRFHRVLPNYIVQWGLHGDPAINRIQVQGHSVLARSAYFNAFERYGFARDGVQWISDDYSRRWHSDRPVTIRGGWSYPIGSEYLGREVIFDWLEDFLKLYFARTIFRANSSFSWWAAFLSPTATVYSPVVNRRLIYGVDGHEEVEYEFVPGNHPHWMYGCDDIHFREEIAHGDSAPQVGADAVCLPL